MDGSRFNDGQASSSSCGMADQRSYDVIPSWEEILDAPILHPQQEYQDIQSDAFFQQNTMPSTTQVQDSSQNQLRYQHIQNQLQHQDLQSAQYYAMSPPRQLPPSIGQDYFENQFSPQQMQSDQFCAFLQQNSMPSTMQVQDSSHNQLRSQHLQNPLQLQKLQSTQHYALCASGELHPTECQMSFQHLQNQNLQSMLPCKLGQPTQISPTEGQVSSHNQRILRRRLLGDISKDHVSQQHYQQQTFQQQLQPHVSLYKFPSLQRDTSMSMYSSPPFIILSPEKPGKRFDRKPTEPDQITEEEMKEFVEMFYMRRYKLGISQIGLGLELSKRLLKEVTRRDVARFERFYMSFRNMCDFKLILEDWLQDIDTSVRKAYSSVDAPESTIHHLKQAIFISLTMQRVLEETFEKNPNPKVQEIKKLAKSLKTDKLTITIWFYDRRHILKRYKPETACSKSISPLPITRSYRLLFQAGRLATPTSSTSTAHRKLKEKSHTSPVRLQTSRRYKTFLQ